MSSRRAAVRLRDVASFDGAFLSNARGIAVVSDIGDVPLPTPAARPKTLTDAYEAVPWDRL